MKPHRWRCWTCRETFPSWAAAQRHVDENRRTVADGHGGRIECIEPEAQK